MENYRKTIKRRIVLYAVMAAVALVIYVALSWFFGYNPAEGHAANYQRGVGTGIISAVVGLMIAWILRMRKALRNEEFCRKLYTQEHDERALLIRQKSMATSWIIVYYVLVVALLVSVIVDESVIREISVYQTLSAVVSALAVITLGTKAYYSRKI